MGNKTMRTLHKSLLRLIYLLAVSLLACMPFITGTAEAAGEFEGAIRMDTKSADGDVQIIYFVRPQIMRTEMRSGQARAITIQDFVKKRMYTLIPQMKQYAVTPLADDEGSDLNEAPPVRTGKTKKILGYNCELYKIKSPEGKTDLWVTKDIPAVKTLSHNLDGSTVTPLRIITYDKSGKEVLRQEVTKIEEKKLSSSLFKPPASYKQFKSPIPGSGYR